MEAEPGFEALVRERNRRWGGHPDHHTQGEADFMRAALLRAGFAEAGTAWQHLGDRVLVGIR